MLKTWVKNLSNKYSQKLLDSAKKSAADASASAKLLQTEQFKKQQKQLVIQLVIK